MLTHYLKITWTNVNFLPLKTFRNISSQFLFTGNAFDTKSKRCSFFTLANELTHGGQDKMATILQTTISNAFCCMEMFVGPIYYKPSIIGSDNGFTLKRWQAIIWTNDDLVYWCKYVSLSLNEFSLALYWWCVILCQKVHVAWHCRGIYSVTS